MGIVLLILSFSLIVAPGVWIAFTLFDRGTPYVVRLALAIALAPASLGLQILLATRLGLSFDQAAMAALLNIAALWLLRPRPDATPQAQPAVWPILLVTAVFAAWFSLLWSGAPAFRDYSWHNMMQAAIVYEVADLPKPLEELDLAGFSVNYAYIGHIQIAAIGVLADLSPLKIFPLVNLASLFALLVLLSHAVDRLRPGRMASSVWGAAIALTTTNLLSMAYSDVAGSGGPGDIRVSTLLRKFGNFDSMTVGLALFAGMIYLTVFWLQARSPRPWIGLVLCAAAIGLVYPLLFPSALLLAGAALAVPPALRLVTGQPLGLKAGDLWAALGLAAALVVFAVHLASLSIPGGGPSASVATIAEIWRSVKIAALAGLLWAPLIGIAAWVAWRTRDRIALCLLTAAAASVCLALVVKLAIFSQYKFTMAGLFMVLPLVVVQGLALLGRFGRAAAPVGVAVTALVALVVVLQMKRTLAPWDLLAQAAPIDERRFQLEPAPQAGAAWAIAVRDRTPRATILLSPPSPQPVSVWAHRASYIATDGPTGGPKDARIGYTMTIMEILAEVKRLPLEVIEDREAVTRAIYDGDPTADFPALFARLTSLDRPVAIYGGPDLPFVHWLKAQAVGHEIFADGGGMVWLIGRGERPRQDAAADPGRGGDQLPR